MEIIINTLTGKSFFLNLLVSPSDSIQDVKIKIFQFEGISLNQQTLLFRNIELEDGRSLFDYNIQNESTIQLVFKQASEPVMKILVMIPTGKTLTFNLQASDKITSLKNQIQNNDGVSIQQQILCFKGQELEDEATLQSYNIQNESMINLELKQINKANQEIYVKTISGRLLTFEFEPQDRIEKLKVKIYKKEGIHYYQQKLIFQDEVLQIGKTLADYNIENGSIIFLSKERDEQENHVYYGHYFKQLI
ncbi:hypothetical protein pb186bvf_001316 [Paramecium bursaria]